MTTTPPDLRPETRARQRAELAAIVGHEATRKPRNHAVPLLAAAAVAAVTAGLAFGVPALRHNTAPDPAAGTKQPLAPLSEADKARFGKICSTRVPLPLDRLPQDPYTVLDAFRFANPPSGTYATAFVVVRTHGMLSSCGFGSGGELRTAIPRFPQHALYDVVNAGQVGTGTYTSQVTRITVAVGNGKAVESVLRHGYYYTALPFVHSPRGPYVVRAYDAAGKQVYDSRRSEAELRARCYRDAQGKVIASTTANPHPDPKTCRPTYVWKYLPD
ncbi:hypothetical protein [Kribbella sp.]|uniref:hypothetical protein n=1 Tax=Kribbella sp. TaxID=1871183 RepID=UPI002D58AD34|nr:hypothetical protein [Kribbella sp.]HZX04173.1 hypothetical protein [Kribbella sp.]